MLRIIAFCLIFSLSSCSGKVSNIFGHTLSLYAIDAPHSAQVKSEVTVTARAVTTGDIADTDLEWIWDQKYGSSISERSQQQIGHSSVFRFRAPASSGDIVLRVSVKGKGTSDSEEVTIQIYD